MKSEFAAWTESAQASITREILKLTQQPGVISFAGGSPSPELFPAQELASAFADILGRDPHTSLQYSVTEGFIPLRERIAEMMADRGVTCGADEIALIHGSQQGLDLVGRLFLEPGDLVLVEEKTYHGAVLAFNPQGVRYRGIPMDEHGMRVDALEAILKQERPKLIYTMPTFHNPTGISMTRKRRQRLAQLVAEYEVMVIEDDAYAGLRYEGEHLPVLKAFDQDNRVIYVSTFSKILCPGLRIGWAITSGEIMRKFNIAQMGETMHVGTLIQRVVHAFLDSGDLPGHIERLREAYRYRRDAMLEGLETHLSEVASWTRPEGGFFTWATLNPGLTASGLLEAAVAEKVAFVPGNPFFAAGGGKDDTMRLSYSTGSVESIQEGFVRLGRALKAVV